MGEEVGGRMVKCAKIFVRVGLFELIFLSFFFEGEKKGKEGKKYEEI